MLTLYQSEWCPSCHRVRQALTELGLAFVAINVAAGRNERADVIAVSGQDTVPVLQDGDKVFTDSSEMIEYLKTTYPVPEDAEDHAAMGAWRAAGALSSRPAPPSPTCASCSRPKGSRSSRRSAAPRSASDCPRSTCCSTWRSPSRP